MFCISYSVTSYNNTITVIESRGGGDGGDLSDINLDIDGFIISNSTNPDMGGGYKMCEEGSKVFAGSVFRKIIFTIQADCSIQIYVKTAGTGIVNIYISGEGDDPISGIFNKTGNGFISQESTLIASSKQSPGAWTAMLKAGKQMTIFARGSKSISIALVFV